MFEVVIIFGVVGRFGFGVGFFVYVEFFFIFWLVIFVEEWVVFFVGVSRGGFVFGGGLVRFVGFFGVGGFVRSLEIVGLVVDVVDMMGEGFFVL